MSDTFRGKLRSVERKLFARAVIVRQTLMSARPFRATRQDQFIFIVEADCSSLRDKQTPNHTGDFPVA
jgi:hypothetical protein